jgi:type I restriction-modification system DNA methylase subunit
VVFIDASRDYEDDKTQSRLGADHIEKVVVAYKTRKNLEKYSYVAGFEEINSTVRVYSLVLKLHSLSRGFVRGGGNFLVRSYQ